MDKLYKWELGIYVTERNIHGINRTHYKIRLQFKSHFHINCLQNMTVFSTANVICILQKRK